MSVVRRLLPLAVAAPVAALALTGAAPTAPALAQGSLASEQSAAAALKSRVAAQQRLIDGTRSGLQDAERRLATLEARAAKRQQQLDRTQTELVASRVHLTKLQNKAAGDQKLLAENLLASYKGEQPTFATVVLDAHGFSDLIERVDFLKRVADRNASILRDTRVAKVRVQKQTTSLTKLRGTYSTLAKAAIDDRDQAAAIKTALLEREAAQLRKRDAASAQLQTVQSKIKRIEAAQAAAARAAAAAASATAAAPTVGAPSSGPPASGGGGGGGDDVVARVVAAANQIATTPYVWGGGHGGSASGGYDCSGSVSYALAAAGLLNGSLTSTGFESWGEPGPGRRITVYANAEHAYMYVDGRRYDTTALSAGGTRWTTAPRSNAGFVARHPPGL